MSDHPTREEIERRIATFFARLADGDADVADLYADDGELKTMDVHARGREEVRAFYRWNIENRAPKPVVERVVWDPPYAAALIADPAGARIVVELFEVDGDRFRRVEAFRGREYPGAAVTKTDGVGKPYVVEAT